MAMAMRGCTKMSQMRRSKSGGAGMVARMLARRAVKHLMSKMRGKGRSGGMMYGGYPSGGRRHRRRRQR